MTLAHYGEALQPRLTTLKPEDTQKISNLLVRRSERLEMRAMEKNRLSILPKHLQADIKRHIAYLKKAMDKLEKERDKLIVETPEWERLITVLLSVKGGGKILDYTLISEPPELGQLNRKEIAALLGVAPMNKESGAYKAITKNTPRTV